MLGAELVTLIAYRAVGGGGGGRTSVILIFLQRGLYWLLTEAGSVILTAHRGGISDIDCLQRGGISDTDCLQRGGISDIDCLQGRDQWYWLLTKGRDQWYWLLTKGRDQWYWLLTGGEGNRWYWLFTERGDIGGIDCLRGRGGEHRSYYRVEGWRGGGLAAYGGGMGCIGIADCLQRNRQMGRSIGGVDF